MLLQTWKRLRVHWLPQLSYFCNVYRVTVWDIVVVETFLNICWSRWNYACLIKCVLGVLEPEIKRELLRLFAKKCFIK